FRPARTAFIRSDVSDVPEGSRLLGAEHREGLEDRRVLPGARRVCLALNCYGRAPERGLLHLDQLDRLVTGPFDEHGTRLAERVWIPQQSHALAAKLRDPRV